MKKFLAGILLLVLILGTGFFLSRGKNFSSHINSFGRGNAAVQKKTFNILLLGYAGGSHDGAYLTDSMMIVQINYFTKTVFLISLPRDLWVNMPSNNMGGSFWKINAAYEIGADDADYPNKPAQFKNNKGALVKYVVQKVTGLTIDRYFAIDFSGFTQIIDDLGGIDVTVDRAFDDYEYPIAGKEDDLCGKNPSDLPSLIQEATVSAELAFPCRYEHIHFDKGLVHMDGATALKFVRSRHSSTDGSDFARSQRQRNLILAVKNKVLDLGFIPKIPQVLNALTKHFSTDFSLTDFASLATKSRNIASYKVQSLALTDKNVLTDAVSSDGQFILIPRVGDQNWEQVKNYLTEDLDNTIPVLSPVIQVENGTTIAGLAELLSNRLKDKDYNVLPPVTYFSQKQTASSIVVYNPKVDKKIISDLQNEIGVSKVQYKTDSMLDYDILVTVGLDYNQKQGKKLIN